MMRPSSTHLAHIWLKPLFIFLVNIGFSQQIQTAKVLSAHLYATSVLNVPVVECIIQ